MADDENASFSNLLLLCPTHHQEVDRPGLVDQHTEEQLHTWKDQQVRESAGQGVELSDDEADEIVRSFTDASTVVNARHLTVGGTGGSAVGASGGGGGAIGAGAVGGPGGPVGRIDLNGTPGQGPGAGGGGGGALADDEVAWSDQELQTGSEGKGGVYSLDGQPGGATSFGEYVVVPDIPWAWLSSGSLLILFVVGPGDVLVVESAGLEAAVQDPDEAVGELA